MIFMSSDLSEKIEKEGLVRLAPPEFFKWVKETWDIETPQDTLDFIRNSAQVFTRKQGLRPFLKTIAAKTGVSFRLAVDPNRNAGIAWMVPDQNDIFLTSPTAKAVGF